MMSIEQYNPANMARAVEEGRQKNEGPSILGSVVKGAVGALVAVGTGGGYLGALAAGAGGLVGGMTGNSQIGQAVSTGIGMLGHSGGGVSGASDYNKSPIDGPAGGFDPWEQGGSYG